MKNCECGRPSVISCPKCGFAACQAHRDTYFTSKGSHIPNVNSIKEYRAFVRVHNRKHSLVTMAIVALFIVALGVGLVMLAKLIQ